MEFIGLLDCNNIFYFIQGAKKVTPTKYKHTSLHILDLYRTGGYKATIGVLRNQDCVIFDMYIEIQVEYVGALIT